MPLALLGLVTIGIGVGLSIPGLVAIGGWWTLLGVVIWQHGRRVDAARASSVEQARGGAVITEGVVTDRRWALGLALVAAVALPSLLVGLLELGIPEADAAWRWLPLVVGGIAGLLTIGALVAGLSGVRAPAAQGGVSDIPVRARITAVRETGTMVGPRPVVELDLEVAGQGPAPYQLTQRSPVPLVKLQQLTVGAVLDGAVPAGQDRPKVRFEWDQPTRRRRAPS